MSTFSFTPEQSRAILDRGGALLVSAGAGSGKTRVLVERLLARVCNEGVNIDDFLVITYTKAAAAELRARILDTISSRLAADPGNRHLRRQSSLVYRAQISTVHAFCAGIIRQNAHLLGIAPDFRSLDEGDSALLQAQVLDQVLEDFYDSIGTDPDFSALVDATSDGRDDRKLCAIALDLYKALQSHAAPEAWLSRVQDAYESRPADPADTPWGRFLLDRAAELCRYHAGQMEHALDLLSWDEKLENAYKESFEATLQSLLLLQKKLCSGFAAARESTLDFPRLKPLRGCQAPAAQAQAKAIRSRCKEDMEGLLPLFQAPETLLEDLAAVSGQVSALFRLVQRFSGAYSREKRRRGLLDFSDLEHLALQLLEEDGRPSPLAESLSHRFAEVCVDEYQDSSRVQEAIFQAVSDGGKKLFLVGDVKQSIYRFRLADPGLFLEKYRSWAPAEAAQPGQARKLDLSRNFRSAPQVLDAVNFVFSNIMSTDAGELDYTQAAFLQPGLLCEEADDTARVEFHLLDCAAGAEDAAAPSRPLLEAGYIARRAKALHEDEGISYRDMVVLMRSPGSREETFIQAFAEAGVPLDRRGGGAYWSQMELQVARSFLSIVDNPRQDVPLISVLRSPLYGFTPDELAAIRLQDREADFYSALCQSAQAGDVKAAAFLRQLSALRLMAADLPADALLRRIYQETAMPAVFGAMPEGRQRQANLMLLLDWAHSFEAAGYKGLFSFLNHLDELIERGIEPQMSESRGETADAVRILSIHRSKGLEFPVVFLADTAHRFNTDDLRRPLLIHPDLGVGPRRADLQLGVEYDTLPRMAIAEKLRDEQLAEEMRLLYVAMTRAKERLIITAAPQGVQKRVETLCSGFSLPPASYQVRRAACMSDWLIPLAAARPEGAPLRKLAENAAAVPCPGAAWDIRHAVLFAEQSQPQPAENTPAAEAAVLPDLRPRLQFTYPWEAAVSLPSKLTATALKGRLTDQEAAAGAPAAPRRQEFRRPCFLAERPLSPTERGTALHLALQFLDLSACAEPGGLEKELQRLGAQRFLSPAQLAAIQPERIHAFLKSPLGCLLLAAPHVTREFKFSLLTDAAAYFPESAGEQILLQGVVDCAFLENSKLTIIDFKTDYVTKLTQAARAAHYRIQLETYAAALQRITALPIGHKFLYFFATGEAVEV